MQNSKVKAILKFFSYFLAAAPAPTSRHLFVVDIVNEESHCITCGMPNCTFQSNIFTPDMEKLLINCQVDCHLDVSRSIQYSVLVSKYLQIF